MAVFTLDGCTPALSGDCYVAPGAAVVGSVTIGGGSSVWFGAVIRGDSDAITIGAGSNIQDGSVLHTDPGFALSIGDGVTVGHQCMLHGCAIGSGSLIGIHSTVLNGATIGRDCLIGAHSLVPEGRAIPDRALAFGAPAKVVRSLSDKEVAALRANAEVYVRRARQYREQLREVQR
ncbi:MAG: gamma carbonic anhydrase family protein [Gammaproteobacteria bacterium]|nr:gamma carbonic anhydrase family protein [Gammaproteobacteria bacterium]MDD9870676.1 gamma carbonic anhydrase family protein [Gammaproteobacteria bacterium]